jgi:hypothetical protein
MTETQANNERLARSDERDAQCWEGIERTKQPNSLDPSSPSQRLAEAGLVGTASAGLVGSIAVGAGRSCLGAGHIGCRSWGGQYRLRKCAYDDGSVGGC